MKVNNKVGKPKEKLEAARLKLLARSQKLEQKGQKLLAKAAAAAAEYEKLTLHKEAAEVSGRVQYAILVSHTLLCPCTNGSYHRARPPNLQTETSVVLPR